MVEFMKILNMRLGALCIFSAIASSAHAGGLSDASEASSEGVSEMGSGSVAAVSAVAAMPLSAIEAIGTISGQLAKPLIESAQDVSIHPLPLTQQTYTAAPAPDEMMRKKAVQ